MQVSIHFKQSMLRYLALHCPLVLLTTFTASWRLKPHCLLCTQSSLLHFNSWVCPLVLNLNEGLWRLLAENGVFVHTGILNASSPALKIFPSSLLSLNTKLYKRGKKTPKQPVSKSSNVRKRNCHIYWAAKLCVFQYFIFIIRQLWIPSYK